MLRPSPNHGTLRLPTDDDDQYNLSFIIFILLLSGSVFVVSNTIRSLELCNLVRQHIDCACLVCSGSVVECQTQSREGPVSYPICYRLGIFVLSTDAPVHSAV